MRLTAMTWALVHLVLQLLEGVNSLAAGERIHDRMTKKEIRRFFAMDDPVKVPEYEVTLPYRVNEKGEFRSYCLRSDQRKRTFGEDNDSELHYEIDALAEKFHLHVRRNKRFMAPGLQKETRDQYGRRVTRPVSKRTEYFVGNIVSDPGSLVALSISDGMTGFMKRSNETFMIYALPPHLADNAQKNKGARPHLIYRNIIKEYVACNNSLHLSRSREAVTNYVDDERKEDTTAQQFRKTANFISKYLEVALLADEQVVENHGDKTEEFLLLMASIVNAIFQDRTAGYIKINYVVTRLIFITNEELGIDPSNSSISHIKVVQKLGAWAKANNRDNQSDPMQFDVASLVRSGSIGGVAPVLSNACSRKDLVNVQRDNGLQTAYFIAHETGHNLHLNHDGSDSCPNYVNIMSTVETSGPYALEWSSCSRSALQLFLSSNRSWCLDDPPSPTRPTPSPTTKLPGQMIDADQQCFHQYGTGYRRCVQFESSCDALYCTMDGYTCQSRFLRPLQGTACGKRTWCIKGRCVDNGLPRIHGGWSQWSHFTECYPPCEGGLRYRQRSCTNPPPQNGGDACVGDTRGFWEICKKNVSCPQTQTMMRDQKCKLLDKNLIFYHVKAANPCRLACRSGRSYSFYGNVDDGLRCNHLDASVYDVCLEGECQRVGCDHVLWSGKFRDRCGVCDGNGDSCSGIKSSYTKVLHKYGYHAVDTIVLLPVGSTRIMFQEKRVTYNLLGVQNEDGTNLIPIPSWWGKVVYAAGTKITYRNNVRFPDRLEIEGPTDKVLKIVFFQLWEANVGINYHYLRPHTAKESVVVPSTCVWQVTNRTECLSGQQKRDVVCIRTDNDIGEVYQSYASNNCCGAESKPSTVKLCPLVLDYSWFSEWHMCSKSCGNGSQSKSIVCRAKINDTHFKYDETGASCNSKTRPAAEFRHCNEIRCPSQWTITWSECSQVCFPGERTTKVRCSRMNEGGEIEQVADIQCNNKQKPPVLTEPCNDEDTLDNCKEYQIGCFRSPAGLFSETLGDFTHENNPINTVMQCKELTRRKNYRVFALGHGGVCMSGADAKKSYYLHQSPNKITWCSNGIGIGDTSVVYSFDPPPKLQAVGCYKDKTDDRAMPKLYANFRPYKDWNNLNATLQQCAFVARDIGYEYFGVQYYGECWSSDDAALTYAKHGLQMDARQCWSNVGGANTNFVYRIL